MTGGLILASTSPFRRTLLQNAGLEFEAIAPDVDERAIEAKAENEALLPDDLALLLAREKALAVSRRFPDAVVLGGDQTMSLGSELFHKSKDRLMAKQQLLKMRGQTHSLNSALALAKNGVILWQCVEKAHLTMREFSESFLETYLDSVGELVFKSVGGYQIEGPGLQLFSKIDGDYFTIVGVPLLPLLQQLRHMGVLHV